MLILSISLSDEADPEAGRANPTGKHTSTAASAHATSNVLHTEQNQNKTQGQGQGQGQATVERCESPLRSLQLASAATAQSGGSAYKREDVVSPSRADSFMVSAGKYDFAVHCALYLNYILHTYTSNGAAACSASRRRSTSRCRTRR